MAVPDIVEREGQMSVPNIEILRNGRGAYAISHFDEVRLRSIRRVPGAIEFVPEDGQKPVRRATISPSVARDFPANGNIEVFVVATPARLVTQYAVPITQ